MPVIFKNNRYCFIIFAEGKRSAIADRTAGEIPYGEDCGQRRTAEAGGLLKLEQWVCRNRNLLSFDMQLIVYAANKAFAIVLLGVADR